MPDIKVASLEDVPLAVNSICARAGKTVAFIP
jgi:hypothetical protein